MNYSRFDYLLKSYCRVSNYSPRQVSKFLGITHSKFLKYIQYPVEIPDVEIVSLVIKKLKIPQNLVWSSYFNSLHELFYSNTKIVLTDYESYEKMIWANKKKRGKGSIPSDEVFLELLDGFSLNGLALADKMKSAVDMSLTGESRIAAISKEYNLNKKLIKKIITGKIISIKEFSDVMNHVSMRDRGLYAQYFINTIIKVKKLPYKILEEDSTDRVLLDRIYTKPK